MANQAPSNYQPPTVADEDANDGNNAGHAGDPAPQTQPEGGDKLLVRFRDQNGGEVIFHMKPTTKLEKAMNAYSAKVEREVTTLRFLFDGQRVLEDDTPASVCSLRL